MCIVDSGLLDDCGSVGRFFSNLNLNYIYTGLRVCIESGTTVILAESGWMRLGMTWLLEPTSTQNNFGNC